MKYLATVFLIISCIIFTTNSQIANAQLATLQVGDTSPTGIANAFFNQARNWKDFLGDRLAYMAAKQVLNQMTVSVVNWINTGFKGKPSFLTNPEGFFLDAADQLTGQFISDSGPLKRLCSPWSVDIKVALAIQQLETPGDGMPNRRKYTCTLSTVIDNYQGSYVNGASIDGFIKGDFKQGGWPAFIALTTEDQNNPIGTILMARSDQMFAVSQKKAFVQSDLIQGKGFLSWESCEDAGISDEEAGNYRGTSSGGVAYKDGPDGHLQKCQYKTPGSVIEASLNSSLQSPARQLELADNINAVVSALVSQLVTKTLQRGLYAMSSGSSGPGSGRLYLQQVYANTLTPTGGTGDGSNPDAGALSMAKRNYDDAIVLVNEAYTKYSQAQACFTGKLGISQTQQKIQDAQTNLSLIATQQYEVGSFINELTSRRDYIVIRLSTPPSVIGNNPIDQVAQNINTQVNGLSQFLSGSNVAALVTSSQSDLNYVRGRVVTFTADAAAFQTACDRL